MVYAQDIIESLMAMRNEKFASNLMRFFKTGAGEYGEGDLFLGIKVPRTRMVVKESHNMVPLSEIAKLLASEWHEVRLSGFLLLVSMMQKSVPGKRDSRLCHAERREELAAFFLQHARRANNWDLVDLSCPKILGEWLLHPAADGNMPDRKILDRLAESDNLWEQRIAIVSTLQLIRAGEFDDTIRIAAKLLPHPHDLIQKATGWMLRELGKREKGLLEAFLNEHYRKLSRTTLRYAIEKMNPQERQYWLHRR